MLFFEGMPVYFIYITVDPSVWNEILQWNLEVYTDIPLKLVILGLCDSIIWKCIRKAYVILCLVFAVAACVHLCKPGWS